MEDMDSESMSYLIIFMVSKRGTINPISMALFAFICTAIYNFFAALQELYSVFFFLSQSFLRYLFVVSTWPERCRRDTDGGASSSCTTTVTGGARAKPCVDEDIRLMKGDVGVVMEKLGFSWDSNVGENVVRNVFDEIEPSLEEVKEAFDIFDGDKDGYIDSKDLQRILSALGFVEFEEFECQKMIMVFNLKNGVKDTKIDFRNFVKVFEESF